MRGLRCSPRVLSSPPPIVFVETAAVVDAHLRRAIARARAEGARARSRSRSLVSERPSALNPVTVAVGADDARARLSNRSVAHAYKPPVVHVPYRSGRTGHGAPKLVHPPVEVHARVAETIGRALERVAAAAVPRRRPRGRRDARCRVPRAPAHARAQSPAVHLVFAAADGVARRGGRARPGGGGPTALRRWAMIEERPGQPGLIADETKGFGPATRRPRRSASRSAPTRAWSSRRTCARTRTWARRNCTSATRMLSSTRAADRGGAVGDEAEAPSSLSLPLSGMSTGTATTRSCSTASGRPRSRCARARAGARAAKPGNRRLSPAQRPRDPDATRGKTTLA